MFTIKYLFSMNEDRAFPIAAGTGKGNRLHIGISSELYAKAYLFYQTDRGLVKSESFLIEKGRDGFDGFFTSLSGDERAAELLRIVIVNLENRKGFIRLDDFAVTEARRDFGRIELQSDSLAACFDEKDGLALTYLTSKKYKITEDRAAERLVFEGASADWRRNANLFNVQDKSRLFAQNYYGSYHPPYQPAVLFDSIWKYNPVQGGDSFGNSSLLLDLSCDKSSLRLKLRPLDRAKNATPTDSLMETSYILHGNVLKMANRFVDYSMLDHRWRSLRAQELPSLYVNCFLDTFAYMSEKTVIKERNLKYWAAMPYKTEQHFIATNHWSAWINDGDYGVGIFSPGLRHHYAGRLKVEGEEEIPAEKRQSVSYTAPIGYFEIENLSEVKYDCYLTVGRLDEIKKTFNALLKNSAYKHFGRGGV